MNTPITTEEFIIKQRNVFKLILEKDLPLQRAVRDTVAKQATRIFVEGKNSQDGLIGQGTYNDNKPLYVNPNTSPGKKFKPAGKPFEFGKTKGGKTKIVMAESRLVDGNATPHKTRWFPSYKNYREVIGRRVDKVDLFLSGDLKSDFSNSPGRTPSGAAKERKVNVHEYAAGFSRVKNALKAEGLEDKYNGPIFTLSPIEKKSFFDVANKEFQLIVSENA